jgi:hypothetical protein
MRNALPRLISATLCLATSALTGACTQQPAEYSWSSPDSGEYLFAYDTRECGEVAEQARTAGVTGATLGSPAFFECMELRGYYLVDPSTGQPLAGVSSPARMPFEPQASR